MKEDDAKLAQMKSQRAQNAAQLTSYQRRVTQTEAGLARMADVLAKYDAVSPIDGVVTTCQFGKVKRWFRACRIRLRPPL